jgi:Sigma-70 region 2
MTATDTHRTIDAVWRIESARLIAGLVRIVRDVGLAEELAQDALVAALERWPESGVPDNPGAWLITTAKHRAIDPDAFPVLEGTVLAPDPPRLLRHAAVGFHVLLRERQDVAIDITRHGDLLRLPSPAMVEGP